VNQVFEPFGSEEEYETDLPRVTFASMNQTRPEHRHGCAYAKANGGDYHQTSEKNEKHKTHASHK